MFIQLNHNTTSFDHLMKAATLPFDHKLAALASFARQAGATFFCVNIRQTEETPPTFVSFHFDAIIPLTAQGIFPSLFHKEDKTELPALGPATLAAAPWDLTTTTKNGSDPQQVFFLPSDMAGFTPVTPVSYTDPLPETGPLTLIYWLSDEPMKNLRSLTYNLMEGQPLESAWFFSDPDDEETGESPATDYLWRAKAIGKAGPYRLGLYTMPDLQYYENNRDNINYLGEPYRLNLPAIYTKNDIAWYAQVDASETPDLIQDLRRPHPGADTLLRKELRKLAYAFLYRCAEISPDSSFSELKPPEVPDHSIYVTHNNP